MLESLFIALANLTLGLLDFTVKGLVIAAVGAFLINRFKRQY